MPAEEREVYSYHTFLYPFCWDDKDRDYSIEAFEQLLNHLDWDRDDKVTEENRLAAVEQKLPSEEQRLDYQAFQYFTPAARKALFRCGGDIVHGWKYRADDIHNIGEYRIFRSGRVKPYVLQINHIRLRLFNTGVGILVFELEYYLPQGGLEVARQDVRAINELGRRIYPEFLPDSVNNYPGFMFADAIEIAIREGALYRENIRLRSFGAVNHFAPEYIADPEHRDTFIHRLLFGECSDITITPAVDDRMFVCCCIADAEYTEAFLHCASDNAKGKEKQQKSEEELKREKNDRMQKNKLVFRNDWEKATELYALTNVDLNDSSCQNREMLDRYFDEQLYLRWSEIGFSTIHAVTNHSMFCLTGDPKFVTASVINPFLIEYVQLCILVLAQRASLIAFDFRITDAITKGNHCEMPLDDEALEHVMVLSSRFSVFQGQILIPEPTTQIQGIELYQKLQNMLFIDRLEGNILRQMRNLFEVSESEQAKRQKEHDEEMQKLADAQEKQEKKTETAFTVLALLAIISAFADFYGFFFGDQAPENATLSKIFTFIFILILTVVILRFSDCIWNFITKVNKKNESEAHNDG